MHHVSYYHTIIHALYSYTSSKPDEFIKLRPRSLKFRILQNTTAEYNGAIRAFRHCITGSLFSELLFDFNAAYLFTKIEQMILLQTLPILVRPLRCLATGSPL